MGLFGKSKAEREREERIARDQAKLEALRRSQEAENEVQYQRVVEVLRKIRERRPSWSVKQIERADQYYSGLECSLEFKSEDGFVAHLSSGCHKSNPAEHFRGGIPISSTNWCRLYVSYESPDDSRGKHIYGETFYDSSSGGYGKCNIRAWRYLDDYLRKILDPYLRRKSEERRKQDEEIENRFWNE